MKCRPSILGIAVASALGHQPVPSVDLSICSRSDCGQIAAWRVGMRAWAHQTEHLDDNYMSVGFGLTVCDSCRPKVVISDLVDNRGWRKIVQHMRARGFTEPNRNSLQLKFEPVMTGTA